MVGVKFYQFFQKIKSCPKRVSAIGVNTTDLGLPYISGADFSKPNPDRRSLRTSFGMI